MQQGNEERQSVAALGPAIRGQGGPSLTASSRYTEAFPDPVSRRCLATARYAGDVLVASRQITPSADRTHGPVSRKPERRRPGAKPGLASVLPRQQEEFAHL